MAAGDQIRDTVFIAQAMDGLLSSGEEFPIKVEGTKTLPYAAVLTRLDADSRQVVIKLVRPLPPALAEGALFEIVFAAQGKRFEGRITYLGREGYLQYRFQGPAALLASDRRLWKRFPIRPRENFQVAAQDADFPGHGLAGPLLNLSLGGLSFRVDRMLRLEDGMPVRPAGHLFDQGMVLSLLRVRGLPKGEVLEARGQVVRIHEADSQLHLSVQFSGLGEAEKRMLSRFLEGRERQSSQGGGTGSGRHEWSGEAHASRDPENPAADGAAEANPQEEAEEEAAPAIEPETVGHQALMRLERRSARLLLVSPPGEDRDLAIKRLETADFGRFECVPDLFEAHAKWKEAGAAPYRMLLVDLEPSRAEGLESIGAVRHLEPLLKAFGALPVAFVTRLPDPMLELMERPGLSALALEEREGTAWSRALEALFR